MTTLPPSPSASKKSPFGYERQKGFYRASFGAGNEARTRDLNLGKVALYQLSYSRALENENLKSAERQVKLRSLPCSVTQITLGMTGSIEP
jgi:hypothetical protein